MQELVLIEIAGKQQYIFKSNRLKENVGASMIIRRLTEEVNLALSEQYGGRLLQKGGGKSLLMFESENDARGFAKAYSRYVLQEAPGVELILTSMGYDHGQTKLWDAIEGIYHRLETKKTSKKHRAQQLSYGIEEPCQSTGRPAVAYEGMKRGETKVPMSAETNHKRLASDQMTADQGFASLLPEGAGYSNDMDQLFRKGQANAKSYIAVVHIDGNRMGEKIQLIREHYQIQTGSAADLNESYAADLTTFSREIDQAYQDAFREMCHSIAENSHVLKEETWIEEGVFPVRPLILAGDDVGYVCYGKIGIESARLFLTHLSKKTVKAGGKSFQLSACAGVSLVKAHYPFYKAYQLAEDLCQHAKKELLNMEGRETSLIDWHIEQGEISGSIGEIRQHNYTADDGSPLHMRPLLLDQDLGWRSYPLFQKAYDNITRDETARSKMKTLREVFRKGQAASETFILANGLDEKTITLLDYQTAKGDYGFHETEGNCFYFDAIECMDLMIPLKE